MTFDDWWATEGARAYCETHEARARQAWEAAIAKLRGEQEMLMTQLVEWRDRAEKVEQLSNQLYTALRDGKPIPLGFRLCDEVQHLLNQVDRLRAGLNDTVAQQIRN